MPNIVYLIQPTTLKDCNSNLYKIGKSKQKNLNRLKSYGTDSEYIGIL